MNITKPTGSLLLFLHRHHHQNHYAHHHHAHQAEHAHARVVRSNSASGVSAPVRLCCWSVAHSTSQRHHHHHRHHHCHRRLHYRLHRHQRHHHLHRHHHCTNTIMLIISIIVIIKDEFLTMVIIIIKVH